MNNLKITMGNYELVHSTNIIPIEGLPIAITLPDDIEGEYTITFQFVTDQSIKSPVTRANSTDKYHLNIEFVNFFGSEQIGNVGILELGTLRNQPLFLNYRITPLRGLNSTILFNFYIRKEVSDGKF